VPEAPLPAAFRVPRTYQEACAAGGGGVCVGDVRGVIPARLRSAPQFPPLASDGSCPVSHGREVTTPVSSGIALGEGAVQIGITNAGDLRHGVSVLASTDVHGWLALKTHFFSRPSYRGPVVVRARRLDGRGVVALGASPTTVAPLVVPPGDTANTTAGWREVPESRG
jgi:hypothetical protein